jgi:hypothetical protein
VLFHGNMFLQPVRVKFKSTFQDCPEQIHESGEIFLLHSLDVYFCISTLFSLQVPIKESYMSHMKDLVSCPCLLGGLIVEQNST